MKMTQYQGEQELKGKEALKQQATEKVAAETRLVQGKTKSEQQKQVEQPPPPPDTQAVVAQPEQQPTPQVDKPPTPAMPAKRAESADEQSSSRSGCDGPLGLALTSANGWGEGKGSLPDASTTMSRRL